MRIQPFQTPFLASSSRPSGSIITVAVGEREKAESGILRAEGIGASIVIALYDSKTQRGYMANIPGFQEEKMLKELIAEVRKEYDGELPDLRVYLAGGNETDPHAIASMSADHLGQYISESSWVTVGKLLKIVFQPEKIKITELNNGMSGTTQLDLATGSFIIKL